MDALREWLAENFVGCTAPLFEAVGLVVNTFEYRRRKTLKRHPDFDRLMIEKVERGLRQPSWQGFVYVMHWNCGGVSPLYVGKTERCGRKQVVSSNIENIRSNDGCFGRWDTATSRSVPLSSCSIVPPPSAHRMASSSVGRSTSAGEEIAPLRMVLTIPQSMAEHNMRGISPHGS